MGFWMSLGSLPMRIFTFQLAQSMLYLFYQTQEVDRGLSEGNFGAEEAGDFAVIFHYDAEEIYAESGNIYAEYADIVTDMI